MELEPREEHVVLTVDEVLEERRKTASRRAVVVEDDRAAEALRQVVEEGVHVFKLGCNPGGMRFDLIVMLTKVRTEREREWFENSILTRLTVGGKVEWAVTRLSLA